MWYMNLGGQAPRVNHWDSVKNLPRGGNVCMLDGSVRWFPFSGEAGLAETYVFSGGTFNSIGRPANSAFITGGGGPDAQGLGNGGYNGGARIVMGPSDRLLRDVLPR